MYSPSKSWRMDDVLLGWFRLRNVKTGGFMDFDPNNVQHMALYEYYRDNPDWQIMTSDNNEPSESDEPMKGDL